MDIEKKLDQLKKINKADPNPFLFTRIQAEIKNLDTSPVPLKWQLTFLLAASIILFINISIFINKTNSNESNLNTIVTNFNLNNDSELYYD